MDFFSEIGHTLTIVLTKGCYCDFSLPEAPLLRHICGDNRSHFASFADGSAVSALRTRLFVEQVGTGKNWSFLLASILLGAAVPYLLLAIEEGFARVAPQTSLIEFAPWADADIMRIVRNRY